MALHEFLEKLEAHLPQRLVFDPSPKVWNLSSGEVVDPKRYLRDLSNNQRYGFEITAQTALHPNRFSREIASVLGWQIEGEIDGGNMDDLFRKQNGRNPRQQDQILRNWAYGCRGEIVNPAAHFHAHEEKGNQIQRKDGFMSVDGKCVTRVAASSTLDPEYFVGLGNSIRHTQFEVGAPVKDALREITDAYLIDSILLAMN